MDLESILDFGAHTALSRQPAVEHIDRSYTYDELDRAAGSWGTVLRDNGVLRGEAVGLYVDDSPHWVSATVAALRLGAAVLPLDPANAEEADMLLGRVAPRWVAGRPDLIDRSRRERVQSVGASWGMTRLRAPRERRLNPDVAYMAPTSGSTASPKIVLGSRSGLASFMAAELGLLGMHAWRVSRLTRPTFDVFWRDLLLPIAARGTLCLLPRMEQRLEPAALRAWLDDAQVEVVHCVPTLLRALGRGLPDWRPRSLRWLMVAGEPLFAGDARPWLDATQVSLVNVYGTSETTLAKFFHVVSTRDLDRDPIPVGACIPGAAAIVLDDDLQPCPQGKPGEIFIATAHHLHGYLDDPVRSHERFVPNPVGRSEVVVDRTGDVGRFRQDGALEVLGRVDDSVKVAGMRVSLGAIEGHLRQHPAVQDCHVAFLRDAENEGCVVAFVSPPLACDATIADLRDWLKAGGALALGVPFRLEFLESIPLTARGKVARRALAEALARRELRSVAPRSQAEALVHRIWEEVLPGSPRFGVHDELDLLGGQSIHVAQIAARLQRETGIRVPLGEIFKRNTIAELARYVDERRAPRQGDGRHASIDSAAPGCGAGEAGHPCQARLAAPGHPREGRFAEPGPGGTAPLAFAQWRFWKMLSRPAAPAFHYLWLGLIDGPLDVERLSQAVRDVAARQPAGRTIFIEDPDSGEPLCRTLPADSVTLEVIAACRHKPPAEHVEPPPAMGVGSERVAGLEAVPATGIELVREWALAPFDLAQQPPLRVCLIELGAEQSLLGLAGHVIVSDGASKDLLLRELGAAYERRPASAPLRHGFAEYALWERGPAAERSFQAHSSYWRARLPATLPRPRLPYSRGSDRCEREADTVVVQVEPDVRGRLLRAGQRCGASEASVLLAAVLLALGDWSEEPVVPVLMPNFNRLYGEEELIAGCWTETALIHVEPLEDISQMLVAAREAVQGMLEHAVPVEWLLDRLYPGQDTCAPETFPIMFAPQPDLGASLSLPGCEVREIAGTALLRQAIFPLHILPAMAAERLTIALSYDTSRFDAQAIHTLAERLERRIEQIALHRAHTGSTASASRARS